MFATAHRAAAGGAARAERHRPGDGRFHPAVCGASSGLRGRRLYAHACWNVTRLITADAKYDDIRTLVEHALQHEKPLPPVARGNTVQSSASRGPSAFGDEHGAARSSGAGLQRNAWPVCAVGEALLSQATAQVRSVSSWRDAVCSQCTSRALPRRGNGHPHQVGQHQKASETAVIMKRGPEHREFAWCNLAGCAHRVGRTLSV